ncbi:MAG: hypothetical protein M3063_15805, partial [Actinomycetota bacterium]|nr:hypothetical protein [Actinomycetota bacterium]
MSEYTRRCGAGRIDACHRDAISESSSRQRSTRYTLEASTRPTSVATNASYSSRPWREVSPTNNNNQQRSSGFGHGAASPRGAVGDDR